jgi:hypothetical protein
MKQIVAYLYPTPEQLDEHLEKLAAQNQRKPFAAFLDRIFNPASHLSPDEHNSIVAAAEAEEEMTLAERTVRDVLAETLGIPAAAILVKRRNATEKDVFIPADLSQIEARVADYLFSGTKTDRYIPESPCGDFIWRTHTGQSRYVSDMASPHIFYALRMIFNHSVPPAFRVLRPGETMNRYPDVPNWTPEYRQTAISAFTRELCSRDDLEPELQAQFDDMKANTQLILALGL